jgi:hypothetical protein
MVDVIVCGAIAAGFVADSGMTRPGWLTACIGCEMVSLDARGARPVV